MIKKMYIGLHVQYRLLLWDFNETWILDGFSKNTLIKTLIVDERKTNLMSLAILFNLLYAQHVSDINISIFRSLRQLAQLQSAKRTPPKTSRTKSSNTQRTENKTTDVVTHQHSRKLLKMDILMSETCWAHNKWNKIAGVIKLVFHSSTTAMMHSPINISPTVILPHTVPDFWQDCSTTVFRAQQSKKITDYSRTAWPKGWRQ